MLPAAHRLRRRVDFDNVYRRGRAVHSVLFKIIYRPNTVGTVRFGIVISNKTIKKATERNRVKRQIRAGLSALAPKILGGWDIVVVCRPQIKGVLFANICCELATALKLAGIRVKK